jgi:hypothetical protein
MKTERCRVFQFVFVDDKNLQTTLLEEMEESQIPEIYGGKMQLISIKQARVIKSY